MKQKDEKFNFLSRHTRCNTMATVITELPLVLHFRFPEFQHPSPKTVIFLILILKYYSEYLVSQYAPASMLALSRYDYDISYALIKGIGLVIFL